jgi:hypothetical protein
MMRATMKLLGLAGLLALTTTAPAWALEPATPAAGPAAPAADEIRLTIRMNERSFGFLAKQEPLARRTMVFETSDHAPTDEMRAVVAELAPLLQAAPGEKAFVITAYAADPTVAYRRARAVRGELIERHQIAAARLVAAGRAAPGHVGGATIVDLHQIDPAACSGCGETPFRTIAFDSGTSRLVTMLPERLAASAGAAAASAAVPPKPAAPRIAPTPAAPKAASARPEPARIIPAAPLQARPAQDLRALRGPVPVATGACPRPRIIIDDYYPGGPIVPCRPGSRSARR